MRVKHLAIIAAALATTVGVTARADSINNYMEVKEGDEQVLTHRFVPCRRIADGELGVYDTVANRFLYDTGREARGAAAFWTGPDVVIWHPGFVFYVK